MTKQRRCSTFRTAASSSAHPQPAQTSTIHWRGGERGQHFQRLMSVIDSASFKNSCMPNSVMQKQMWLEDGGLKRFNSSSLSLSAKTEKNQMCNVFWQEQAVRCLALNSSCSEDNFLSRFKRGRTTAKQTTAPSNHRKAVVPRLLCQRPQQGPGHSNPGVVEPASLQLCHGTVRTCFDLTAWTEPQWAVTSCASFEPYTSIQQNTGHASSSTCC